MIKELAKWRGAFGAPGLLAIQTVQVQIPEHRKAIEVVQPPGCSAYSSHVALAVSIGGGSVTRAAGCLHTF